MAQEIKGIIEGIGGSTNPDPNGRWKNRVSFQIGGVRIGAFDEGADEVTAVPDGAEVKLQHTASKDGRYKNYVKGSIIVIGQGEAPVTEEEEVKDTEYADIPTVSRPKDDSVTSTASTIPAYTGVTTTEGTNEITQEEGRKMDPEIKDTKGAVANYKEAEADKFDLGMAKNGAIEVICASMKDTGKMWTTETDSTYKQLVTNIFRLNQELRKELSK